MHNWAPLVQQSAKSLHAKAESRQRHDRFNFTLLIMPRDRKAIHNRHHDAHDHELLWWLGVLAKHVPPGVNMHIHLVETSLRCLSNH